MDQSYTDINDEKVGLLPTLAVRICRASCQGNSEAKQLTQMFKNGTSTHYMVRFRTV